MRIFWIACLLTLNCTPILAFDYVVDEPVKSVRTSSSALHQQQHPEIELKPDTSSTHDVPVVIPMEGTDGLPQVGSKKWGNFQLATCELARTGLIITKHAALITAWSLQFSYSLDPTLKEMLKAAINTATSIAVAATVGKFPISRHIDTLKKEGYRPQCCGDPSAEDQAEAPTTSDRIEAPPQAAPVPETPPAAPVPPRNLPLKTFRSCELKIWEVGKLAMQGIHHLALGTSWILGLTDIANHPASDADTSSADNPPKRTWQSTAAVISTTAAFGSTLAELAMDKRIHTLKGQGY